MKFRTLSFTVLLIHLMLLNTVQSEENATSDTMTIMTFNVLCSVCNLGEYDLWPDRLKYFTDIIDRHDPDLIGFQEFIWGHEVDEVLALNQQYEALYFKDPDSPLLKDLPDSVIFYRKDRFEVIEEGDYGLSPTPDTPWSFGWNDFQLWRLVYWAHLRQIADGRELYFATTHFDPNSPNQEHSAPLVIERTESWAQRMPIIVTGDFNSKPNSNAYKILTEGIGGSGFHLTDTFDIADWNGVVSNQTPAPKYDHSRCIDHIFIEGQTSWRCSRWIADMYVYGPKDRHPSDHLAIVAELELDDWATPTPEPTTTPTLTPTQTPTPTPTATTDAGPRVLLAGYWDTTSPDTERIRVIALMRDFTGNDSISTVTFYQPLSGSIVPLFDDGNHGDFAASDGIWGVEIPTVGLDRQTLLGTINGENARGLNGRSWPFLWVEY